MKKSTFKQFLTRLPIVAAMKNSFVQLNKKLVLLLLMLATGLVAHATVQAGIQMQGVARTVNNQTMCTFVIGSNWGGDQIPAQTGSSYTFSNARMIHGTVDVTLNGTLNFQVGTDFADVITGSSFRVTIESSSLWFYGATVQTKSGATVSGCSASVSSDKHTLTVTIPQGKTFGAVVLDYVSNPPMTNSNTTVTVPQGDYWVSNSSHKPKPEPTVVSGQTTLVKDTDYTLSWSNNSSAGTGTVTVTGIGNYAGSATGTFPIRWARYYVHFDKNHDDATGTMSDQQFTYNTEQALTDNTFSRTGYSFVGWSTTSNGAVAYTDGQSVNNLTAEDGQTVTLYAQWTLITYDITYELDGGSVATANPTTYHIETATFTLNNPTRTGYTFTGWTGTDLTEATQTVTIAQGSIGDRSYTATWTPITYNIAYDLGGGSVATTNPTTYNIETATFTLNNPTRTGYTFAGWTGTDLTEATQTVTIAQGSIGDRSYTATWTPTTYNLTYDLAGGSVATANPTTYNIETATFTLNNPTRTGYTFAGWTGTDLSEATMNVTIAQGSYGNREYTATWNTITYNISYDLAGGSVATANPTTYHIETATFTLNNPTRTGYTFAGWTGTDLDEPTINVTIAQGSMGNLNYTANWNIITYNLTYDLDGGSVATANPTTYTVETPTFTLVNPTREHYTFNGWTGTDLSEGTMEVTIAQGSTGDRSYTATWTLIPVTYIDADGNQQTCSSYTIIESSESSVTLGTSGQDEWYVVSGDVTINGEVTLIGSSNHIILCDGATLTTANPGNRSIYVNYGSLTIYRQSQGTGTIVANGSRGFYAETGLTIHGGNIDLTTSNTSIFVYTNDLTINGGTINVVSTGDDAINTHDDNSHIIINGGIVNAVTQAGGSYKGIRSLGGITLGYTNLSDRITVSSYSFRSSSGFNVKDGQSLTDGTAVYSGSLNANDASAMAGQTLQPCFSITLPAHVNATGVISQEGTTAYALAGAEITLAAAEGYEITGGTVSFTMPAQDVVSDVTVQIITYNITYDLAGGSVATANPTTYNIETATFTLNNPTREHYTFAGWTGTDLDEPTMDVTIAQGSIGARSYTATWTPITYNIAYDLAGGSVATANPTTYNIETATFTLNNPTREGYTFVGWTGTDLSEPTQTVTIAQGSIGDRTYTATWDRLERYYTFDSTTGELALIWGEYNKDNKWGNDVTPSAVTSVTATDEVSFTGDCSSLFRDFTNCTSMDLNNVNTNGVTNMACMFEDCSSLDTLDLSGWNTGAVTRMDNLFFECTKLKTLNLTGWDVSHVTRMTVLFFNCQCLTTIEGIKQWDPSHVTGMHSMFEYCKSLKSLDLSGWNTESLTDMGVMFMGCDSIQTLNLSGWDVSNVTDMNSLFWGCKSLETLDVSGWNTSSVTKMGLMFYDCSSLTTLHRSEWNTENVTNMGSMFYRCSSLTTLDLSDWNTENVTDMWSMFTYCSNLATIYAGEGWSVESAASASGGMFYDCTSLVGGNGTAYDDNHIDGEYARIDRPGEPGYLTGVFTITLPDDVTTTMTPTLVHGDVNLYAAGTDITLNYSGEVPEGFGPVYSVNGNAIQGNTFAMPFEEATVTVEVQQLRYIFNSTTGELALLYGEFNKDNKWGADVPADAVLSVTATDEVSFTGDCSDMFHYFTSCTSIDLSQVNTDECTNMSYMFGSCLALTTLDVSNFNTANVTDMSYMFASCNSLESLDLSNFNTASVTNMLGMFVTCSSLESLDVSNWNTANVTNMNNMFLGCWALESLDLSNFNTAAVTNMNNMFLSCRSLESLDVSGWNTASVTNMGSMFNGCSNLTTLDLSSWSTAAVTDIATMFIGCSNLTTIYVGSEWNAENITNSGGMFYGCTNLVGGNGTAYDVNHIDGEYARIDRPSEPGYLSAIPLDPVEYIDADGQTAYCQNYTILNGSTDYIDYGEDDVEAWYVVDHDVTYSDGLYFDGPTNLILVDGATLTINEETEDNGYMSCNGRLTIYVQSEGTGAITAVNSDIAAYGDLIIHGGHIALSSDNDQAYMYSSGDMTINGGAISIENGEYSCIYVSGQLTINDGTLNAVVTEGYYGYDVIYSEEDVVINGGNITVTNQGYGRGIVGDNVTINGGCVKVYIVEDYGYSGIGVDWWDGEAITLGWTDPSDLIMSQGGYDTEQLSIALGQAFTDGEGNYFLGTYYNWDEIVALAGKTLRPFTNLDELFHITYVTNGGTLPDGYPTTYTFDETVELPVPTKENNAFAGWFDNAEFNGDPVTEIVAGTALGDKTFYAKWMPANTWVEYLDADGQQQRVYATVLYGIEKELPGGVYTIVDDGVSFDKLSFTGTTTIILPDNKYLYVECMGKGTNDDEYSLFVNGDLTIYGQEHGDGVFDSYNVQVSGDVAIYGGTHVIGQLSANNGSGTITLSWTGWESYIRVTVYLGKVVLAKAFIDDDDNIHEAGTVANVTTINDQFLHPWITETEVSYLDENGVLQTVTATVLYGGEEAEYPGGVYTVLDMVIRGQAYYDRLHFTGDATIILPDWCSFGVAATKEDNEYWLHVDGDLTIYGQEYGNGQCLFSNVTVNGHVNVYGGWVVLYNISANEINLSWTSIQNEHMVNPTQGTTVNLLKDFMYYDDDNNRHVINAQQNVDITTIAERYLKPYAETIDVSYIDENGDAHTENATVLFGDETSLSGGTYTIINYTSFSQAVSFSGNTKLIIPDGIEVYGYYQGGGINLNVTGDLAIYGQENRSGTVLYINASVSGAVTVSNVRVIYSFINSESDILIAGGEHEYGQLSANGTITLGCLTFNDQIYCEDYEGTVAIRAGQTMIDYGTQKTYTGTLTADKVTAIKERYLKPYYTSITLDVAGYGESTESDHWVFIASPIVSFIDPYSVTNLIGGMSPSGQSNFDLYRFNQSAELEWENYQQHNTTNDPFLLENGKGYLYANKKNVTLEFNGAVYPAASKEVVLDYDANAEFAGWNLVGNPFNAPATLDKSYYKMNSTGTGLVAEAVSGNTTIEAFTGVMVQAENENDIVTFVKTVQKSPLPGGPQGGLEIALTQAGNRGNALMDNAIVSFNEGDQLGKFYFGTQDANIYIPVGHEEYAIAYAGNQTEIPLNFKASKNGEYTLTVSYRAITPNGVTYLHLVDHLTGADIDLLPPPCPPQKGGGYTFEARTSDYASRFKLVFNANGAEDNDDFAFIDADGNIVINGTGTLQIIDMLGHVLATRDVHSDSCLLSSDFLSSGVYVVRLINGEKVKTQKIVIQ